jgi:hypothetical protein
MPHWICDRQRIALAVATDYLPPYVAMNFTSGAFKVIGGCLERVTLPLALRLKPVSTL